MRKRAERKTVADLYQELGRCGLTLGSSGNVSLRTRDGMVITPSGGSPEGVRARDMAVMALDGESEGEATPSSEWPMHAAIYRTTQEAGCIIHTHSDACPALACEDDCALSSLLSSSSSLPPVLSSMPSSS